MDVPPSPMQPNRTRGLVLAAITAAVWGTVPIAGKVALGSGGAPGSGLSPPVLSALRLLVAAGCFYLALARRGARPRWPPPPLVFVCGLGLGANYLLYMFGLERAGAGTAQVLIQTAPLFLVLLSVLLLGERPGPRALVGAAVAVVGVTVVSWNEQATQVGSTLGVALVLAAALAWSVYAVAHKRLGKNHTSGGTMTWTFLIAGLVCLPFVPAATARTPDPLQWIAIVYLIANAMVAYGCFAEALRHIDATTAAVIVTLGPVITFGCLLVTNAIATERVPTEPLPPIKWLGAALVVSGVIAAVTARRRPPLATV